MAYELREGKANLFRNDRKTSENQPDFKGGLLINGQKMKVAMWEKEGANGTYLSMSIEVDNYERPVIFPGNKAPKPVKQPSSFDDLGDDVPF